MSFCFLFYEIMPLFPRKKRKKRNNAIVWHLKFLIYERASYYLGVGLVERFLAGAEPTNWIRGCVFDGCVVRSAGGGKECRSHGGAEVLGVRNDDVGHGDNILARL